jgi:hypothetical protein
MQLTSNLYLYLEKRFSEIPCYAELKNRTLGVDYNPELIRRLQPVHSKPHGQKMDEDSELDVLCESEDEQEYLFNFKRSFLKKLEKLKDVDVLETLVILRFKQVYRRAVQLRTEFEESFSLSKINPFFMKNLTPIILS